MLLFYFQPLLPPVLALWLWGHNVQRFGALGIEYDICFSSKDRKCLLPYGDIYRIALALTAASLTWAAAFTLAAAAGATTLADHMPPAAYLSVLALLLWPLESLCPGRAARFFFLNTLQRVAVPIDEVSWADFLLADILTSLSKSAGDMAKAVLAMLAGPSLQALEAAASAPGSNSPIPALRPADPCAHVVLFAIVSPYLIRLIQCLLVHRATGNRGQLFNALKYGTAFPALLLTALEHEYHVVGRAYPLARWWLAALAANSAYSAYWDVEMDWDMPWLAQPGGTPALRGLLRLPGLRPDPLYTRPAWWYGWLCWSNLALRLSWTHRLMGNLENHAMVALALAVAEVFRRYQWTYVRVETEIRRIRVKQIHEHPSEVVSHGGTAHGLGVSPGKEAAE